MFAKPLHEDLEEFCFGSYTTPFKSSESLIISLVSA